MLVYTRKTTATEGNKQKRKRLTQKWKKDHLVQKADEELSGLRWLLDNLGETKFLLDTLLVISLKKNTKTEKHQNRN